LRWGNDQWPLPYRRGHRGVLDELDEWIAEHHCAGRTGQVLANFEHRFLHLRRQAAVLHEILEIVLEPAPQALAPRVDELLERRRIGQKRVGRGERVDDDRRDQARPRLVELSQAALIHELVDRASPGEVGLKQTAVHVAALPRGIGKPLVAVCGAALRLAGRDLAELAHEPKPLAGGDGRLVGRGLEQGCGAIEQIPAAHADEWVERQRVARGLV
jgi:hypothetical protein